MQAPEILKLVPKLPNLIKKCTLICHSQLGQAVPTGKPKRMDINYAVTVNEVYNLQSAVWMGRKASLFPA